jgi:EmrB/QacA subfamily drug resistance transporter
MSESWASSQATSQTGRRWVPIAVLLTGAFMILLDATIVNIAIPPIEKTLHANNDALEWIVAGYALAYGLLLIPAGRLGDRHGHKKVFLIGLAGFTVASTLCAVSVSPGELVAWRIVQGVMAGVMNPPILALIQAAFPPQERGKAYGAYGAVAGVSTALGPLIGGLLIQWNLNGWDWRPVFMINVPIGIAAFIAAIFIVPESRGRPGPIDIVGVALVTLAVLLLTYPLIEGRYLHWPVWTFVSMAASVPAMAAFALWEIRREGQNQPPLVSMGLFKHRSFSAGVGLSVTYFAGFIGLLFALSLYLQIGLSKSALSAGLALLPFPTGSLVGASLSDWITRKIGRMVLTIGSGLLIIGIVGIILTIHYEGSSALQLLPAMVIGGFGSGMVIAPSTEIVLAGVPWQDAGSASGVLSAAQRLGQAIGIAVIGVVLFSVLGTHAKTSVTSVTPELRQGLAVAHVTGPAADRAIHTFVTCFGRQSNAADPAMTPSGCPAPNPSTPTGAAFVRATAPALKTNFSVAAQVASGAALIGIVITFLLVFLLPRNAAAPWTGSEDWGSGGDQPGSGSGDWGGSAGDGGGDWAGSGVGGGGDSAGADGGSARDSSAADPARHDKWAPKPSNG